MSVPEDSNKMVKNLNLNVYSIFGKSKKTVFLHDDETNFITMSLKESIGKKKI